MKPNLIILIILISLMGIRYVHGNENAVERGYKVLTELPVLTSDFNQSTFDQVWRSWPTHLRSSAERMSKEERTKIAYQRYGLSSRPGTTDKPLQYVVSEEGNWTMNCFTCHGGTIYGNPYPGAPNNKIALQTLTEEIRATKFRVGAALSRMDLGALVIPLGTTNGTTNAVVFGMGLMNQRDTSLNYIPTAPKFFVHHDMDAPPWWYSYKKERLYIDGFAEKGHRGLMQFMLIPENGPEFFQKHEEDFRDVYAYLMSLRPPKFEGNINRALANKGRNLFESNCSDCHGTYGKNWTYPNLRIPLEEIKTDPVRLHALSVEGRTKYAHSWFAHAGETGEQNTITAPDGYVAPPLDGIWASSPYFHNGSVPTLWGVLRPKDRPAVWIRDSDELDAKRVGTTYSSVDSVPTKNLDVGEKRSYFDTRVKGKSNQGHLYGERLSDEEVLAIIEYLKTL